MTPPFGNREGIALTDESSPRDQDDLVGEKRRNEGPIPSDILTCNFGRFPVDVRPL